MSAEISMKINWKSNEKIFKQKSWKTKAQFYEVHFVMVDLTTEDLKTIRPLECLLLTANLKSALVVSKKRLRELWLKAFQLLTDYIYLSLYGPWIFGVLNNQVLWGTYRLSQFPGPDI